MMLDSEPIILIITTVDSESDVEKITKRFLEKRLAACIQVDPKIKSYYHWKGRIVSAEEHRMVIKTTSSKWLAAKKLLSKIHPYDLPEITKIEPVICSKGYADWVTREASGEYE
ncbi:MAG: divalent-cation tolerance protein CutA [Planctomycetota bacterium]|nr:divalent-cation tolerance protein CutA [Planctomycetota bacterium]